MAKIIYVTLFASVFTILINFGYVNHAYAEIKPYVFDLEDCNSTTPNKILIDQKHNNGKFVIECKNGQYVMSFTTGGQTYVVGKCPMKKGKNIMMKFIDNDTDKLISTVFHSYNSTDMGVNGITKEDVHYRYDAGKNELTAQNTTHVSKWNGDKYAPDPKDTKKVGEEKKFSPPPKTPKGLGYNAVLQNQKMSMIKDLEYIKNEVILNLPEYELVGNTEIIVEHSQAKFENTSMVIVIVAILAVSIGFAIWAIRRQS